MTTFGCPVRNAQDIKVLLVGVICTVVIFTVVTMVQETSVLPILYVDLVLNR